MCTHVACRRKHATHQQPTLRPGGLANRCQALTAQVCAAHVHDVSWPHNAPGSANAGRACRPSRRSTATVSVANEGPVPFLQHIRRSWPAPVQLLWDTRVLSFMSGVMAVSEVIALVAKAALQHMQPSCPCTHALWTASKLTSYAARVAQLTWLRAQMATAVDGSPHTPIQTDLA